jgi:hypothetical protein
LAAIVNADHARESGHINVPNENYETIVRQQLRGVRTPHPARAVLPHPHQRMLVPRPRPGVRQSARGAAAPEMAIVDWGFNAWGGKYPPFDADDAVPTRIGEAAGAAVCSRAS